MTLHQNEVRENEESNKGKGKENRKQKETGIIVDKMIAT